MTVQRLREERVWYLLDFGDLKINLNEQKLLELFEAVDLD